MKKNVIKTLAPEKCCGCAACVSVCPKHCITMIEDKKGFLCPYVDNSTCIECGKCEASCQALHSSESRSPLSVWAGKNINDVIRMASSSGGVFYALAEWIINHGGIVFGARYDDKWEVVHDHADTIEGVKAFMGSKYLQSRVGESYIALKQILGGGVCSIHRDTVPDCWLEALFA